MDIRLPNLSEGVSAGTVVAILVKPGDTIAKDQAIIELETEKAVAQIPTPAGGKVEKVHIKEGDKIQVGQLILSVSGSGESAAAPAQAAPAAPTIPQSPARMAMQSAPTRAPTPGASHVYQSKSGFPPPTSPSIRKMAAQLGLDLAHVPGTADGGRITLDDVRYYLQQLQSGALQGQAPAGGPSAAAPSREPSVDFTKWGPVHKKPFTTLRQKISEQMVRSWTTIPHVTQFDEFDVTELMELRKRFAADYEKKGAKLTLTPFVMKAIVTVLQKFPQFNASIDETANEVVYKDYYHLGIAVDTEQGLIVPVIRDVNKKDLLQLSIELQELAEKTRARKVAIEDLKGGTFTISNQGPIGSGPFTPIINKPEVAILGMGRGSLKPLIVDGKVTPRQVLPVGMSYDHRLIDGGSTARFMVELAQALAGFTDKDVTLGKTSPDNGKNKSGNSKKK